MSTQHTMRRSLLLLLLAVVIVGLVVAGIATSVVGGGQPTRYYAGIFPVELPEGGGLATLELRMYEDTTYCSKCNNCCNEEDWRYIEVAFAEEKSRNVRFVGDTLWSIQLDDEHRAETQFNVELQSNDTCYVRMIIRNQTGRGTFAHAYIVTAPDTTEFWHYPPGPRLSDRLNRKPDTTLYRAWIDLSDPRRRQVFLEGFSEIEHKYGKPVPVGDSGIYHFSTSRGAVERLIRERWRAGYIDTPPPMPDLPAGCSVKVETGPRRPPVKNPRRPRPTSKEDSSQGSSPVR